MAHRTTILAGLVALGATVPLRAQEPVCTTGGEWAYTGTARGSASISNSGKGVLLQFTPAGPNEPDSVAFSSVNPATSGVYQVNADVDVLHMSDDAAFDLLGATSAAAGRPFEVVLASGDGGSSGFSRPIKTTDHPFTVRFKTQARDTLLVKIRNYVVCKVH